MMIEAQYERAIQILEGKKDKLTVLADLLLEKEVIFKDDLEKIFGKRPFEDVLPVTESEEKKVIKKEEEIQSLAEPTEE